jgi:G:T-mismatch repair DNA endonuclease (very short patch repair protein)
MADTIAPERRSEIMSHIKSKDTSIELMVRRYLFALGYRYRINYKALPGKPDIVFTKKKMQSLFTAVTGMDMIVGAGMHTPVSRIRHIGDRKFREHSNGIRSILLNLKQMGGE